MLTSAALLVRGHRAAARRLCSSSGLLFLAARAAPAAALALVWLPGEAHAVCAPASPVNNADVTCTGATVNQNAPSGYGGFGDTGNTITVVPGASVTGTTNGIVFNNATVSNSGTVAGGTDDGILGITGNVSNTGTITGGIVGIFVSTVTVSNSGTISGGTADGVRSNTANVTNSGAISGGANGINAITGAAIANVTNSGTISGGTADGIATATANVSNSGTITGGFFGIDATAIANVTNSGAILGGTNGIATSTANVTNSGTISGGTNEGIEATNATVSNSGTISGGAFGHGILTTFTAIMTNSGTISGGVNGIDAGTAIVSNSGTISGGGAFATSGIRAGTAIVSNSGFISGGSNGINAGTANVSNSGSIAGGINGINAGTANVTNSGTITGNIGINVFAGPANVANSGTISGGIAALQFVGNPDTLTLLPGSTIIGAINLGGGGDTVNFRTGNQNLTFDTLAGATVTSSHPFVVVGNRVVTIDPTSFGMADRTLMDFTRGLSAAIPDINNVAAAGGAPLAFVAPAAGDSAADRIGDAFAAISGLAYAGEANVFKNPTVLHADGTAIWARGFLGERVQPADGALLRAENHFYGGMLGADRQVNPNLRIGIFGGGGETRTHLGGNAGDTNSTLVFGGASARWRVADTFLNLVVQAGHSDNETSRNNINNNLAPGGLESAKATFDGWYVNPEATVGVNYVLGSVGGGLYTLTPSARLSYLYAAYDGYTETGSTANLTVGGRNLHNIEERGQLKLTRTQGFGSAAALSTSLYGGVLAVQRVGDTTINASLLGQLLPFATPGDDNVWGGYGGVGLAWRTADGVSFFGTVEYTALSDNSSIVAGQAGLRVAF